MRLHTTCFNDFCKYLNEQDLVDGYPIEEFYTIGDYDFITWKLPSIREHEAIYSRAYNDALNECRGLK